METIKIAALKAKLSEIIRRVRSGESFTIMDRETPVAYLTVYRQSGLQVASKAKLKLSAPESVKIKQKTDSLMLLREDRDRR